MSGDLIQRVTQPSQNICMYMYTFTCSLTKSDSVIHAYTYVETYLRRSTHAYDSWTQSTFHMDHLNTHAYTHIHVQLADVWRLLRAGPGLHATVSAR